MEGGRWGLWETRDPEESGKEGGRRKGMMQGEIRKSFEGQTDETGNGGN